MLKLYYPFKPFVIAQKWGNPNPMYKDNGFTFDRHNGIDANKGSGRDSNRFPVYCPIENAVVQLVRNVPKGGGNEMWLMTKDRVQIGDKNCFAYMPFSHAEKVLLPSGYEPKLGELMMIADSTGFSTGPHTHMGLYRIEYDGRNISYLDDNDANGSSDPEPFFTGEYAVDKADFPTMLKSVFRYYSYNIGL